MTTLVSESIDNREMTSIKWLLEPEFAGIQITEPSGWEDYEHFYRRKIQKDEFVLRLAKSDFKKNEKKS
jgi:hypothetical protein